jgi:hypothetical protein
MVKIFGSRETLWVKPNWYLDAKIGFATLHSGMESPINRRKADDSYRARSRWDHLCESTERWIFCCRSTLEAERKLPALRTLAPCTFDRR